MSFDLSDLPISEASSGMDLTKVNKILDFNPYSLSAWGWFALQLVLQLYAATYFGCMAKLAKLPSFLNWLFWPAVISSAGVNFLLHVTCGQSSYRLFENYFHRSKAIRELHKDGDTSSQFEAVSLVLEIASVSAIAGLSLVPYISIDDEIEGVCPFFSGPAIVPLTITSFFWVGFPASATLLPWVSEPLDTLLQTIANSIQLTHYIPGLGRFWARKSIALPLDAIQATIHQTLNRIYWSKYDSEKTGQTLNASEMELREIAKLEQSVGLIIGNLKRLDVSEKEKIMTAFFALYNENKQKTHALPSGQSERTAYFLLGWLSYFAYFIPVAQDEQLHPTIILSSILVCTFLCVIAADSVYSIRRSFFPLTGKEEMANYYYHYRTLSYTLAWVAISLIVAAFLSAAPCFGLSQEELLDKVPENSWFSISSLIFFVIGTTAFNFAFCADTLQETTNTYYTLVETDNITAKHFWVLMLMKEMIKGLERLPAESCKAFVHDTNIPRPMVHQLESGNYYRDRDSETDRASSSVSTLENPLLSGASFDSVLTDNSSTLTTYNPEDRSASMAETVAIFLQIANVMLSPRLYQQTEHGIEVYAVNLGISILCKYLIPMDFSCEKLAEVTCSSLFTILVGLTLDQAFLTYFLGSLATNTWWPDFNEGNSVLSKETSLGIGLITAALYSPHATKLTQDYLSQKCGPRGS